MHNACCRLDVVYCRVKKDFQVKLFGLNFYDSSISIVTKWPYHLKKINLAMLLVRNLSLKLIMIGSK